MNVRVSEKWEAFIRSRVRSGRYPSEGEVLDEALRLLRDRDQGLDMAHHFGPGGEETAFDVLNRAGLIGSIKVTSDSPTDLSTSPAHMEGFGPGESCGG